MTKCTFRNTCSSKKYATKFVKRGIVDKSKKENESDNNVKKMRTVIDPKKLPRYLRKKRPASTSYKETSNSEEDEKPPKINKFSKYETVSKSKSGANSEDSVETVLTVIQQKEQLSNQQVKHPKSCKKASDLKVSIIPKEKKLPIYLRKYRPASKSYKETSNSEKDENPPKIKKFSKYASVSKSKSEVHLEDSVEEVLTVIYPKKQLSNQQITKSCKKASGPKVSIISKEKKLPRYLRKKCRASMSYKETSNSEEDDKLPKITKFSKYATVSKSKSGANSEDNVEEVLTLIYPKKQLRNSQIKHSKSCKKASDPKVSINPKEKTTKLSCRTTHSHSKKYETQFSKYVTVGQHVKCPPPLSYKETSNSESETDYENDIRKTQTKTYRQKRFSKRHIKQPTSVSYKEASNSESEESPIEKRNISSSRKQSYVGNIIKYDSNKKSQADITSVSSKIADKLIPFIKANKKLTCKMVEEVNVNFQPNVKKKDTCTSNSNLPAVKHCKEKLDIIASKSAIKKSNVQDKILLKEDNASKTHSNKEYVGQCNVLLTPIDIKSDNSINKHMKNEFILSKDHIFETRSTKDITDGINKPLNCFDFTSKSLKTKIAGVGSSQLLPCSVVNSPIHLAKCDSHANFFEVLENITKVSSNTAIQIFDTNELSAKGSVLDTSLQPGFVSLNKSSYPNEPEMDKLKTAPFETEKFVRKQVKEDFSSSLNKCTKTFDFADEHQEFDEGLSKNSFGESVNCTPCSVRLTRLSLDNFNTNVNSKKDKLSKSNISLDNCERIEGIVSDKQKKYSFVRVRKNRFTEKKHIACNSTDLSACVKKINSKNPKLNTSTPCNIYEKSVNDDNTSLHHLKNSNIVFDNYNTEEHTFCNSRSQLTSKKKSSKNNPKINTRFPDNRVFKSPSSADLKRKRKPTNYRLARSYKKLSKKSPLKNACGVEVNSYKLQSKIDHSKRPRYFLSKEVSKSFKNSIKKRKASRRTTGCEEQKHGCEVLRKKAQSNFMCVQCNQSVSSLKALYEHLCFGKREKGYLCCICEKNFQHYSQFKKHKKFHLSHRIALDENLLP